MRHALGLAEDTVLGNQGRSTEYCQQVFFQYLQSIHTHLFPLSLTLPPDYHLYEIVQPASLGVQCVRTTKSEWPPNDFASLTWA